MRIRQRIEDLGLTLPPPMVLPHGATLPFPWVRVHGRRAFVSGHGPLEADGSLARPLGKVGREVTLEQGYASARQCAINHLAWLKVALGDLDRLQRVLKLNGYVNAVEGYNQGPWVVNGASDFLVALLGPERGSHARAVVSVAGLAFDAPVETEMVLQIRP